jgi:CDP-diglyceride synthetase
LIKLSPKKTVEGFIGAWVFTIIFGSMLANWMMRYKFFICQVNVSIKLFEYTTNNSRTWAQTSSLASNAM